MSVLLLANAPSLSALFMAAAASALLLLVARVLFSLWSCPMVRTDSQGKESSLLFLAFFTRPWGRSLQWNTLPVSLPFTLTLPEKSSPVVGNGVGMGLSQKAPQMLQVLNWRPRAGPRFQPPPPALYENPVPLSMAKMIMSRHTFRRPNPNRVRKSSAASSSQPTSPPQTPSRLYHSIA